MLATFAGGDDADDDDEITNPYGGQTIEWSTTSPAPAHNFDHVPTITSAEPLLDQRASTDAEPEGSPS
jgi:heme/copper-type cytochrome/quinol oxidase subunit 1